MAALYVQVEVRFLLVGHIPMKTLIRCSVVLLSIYGKTQLILYQVKHSLSVLYSQVLFNVLCSSQNY